MALYNIRVLCLYRVVPGSYFVKLFKSYHALHFLRVVIWYIKGITYLICLLNGCNDDDDGCMSKVFSLHTEKFPCVCVYVYVCVFVCVCVCVFFFSS